MHTLVGAWRFMFAVTQAALCNMDARAVRVGSRRSELALVQTRAVCDALTKHYGEERVQCTVVHMETVGDKVTDRALQKIGDKDLWTKELDVALSAGQVDFVVHSLKDLPTQLPPNMVIGAILQRADPRDAVVFHPRYPSGTVLQSLPADAVLGTSSLRRAAQLKARFPQLKCEVVRGNLNTRLKKLDEGNQYDALILAAAGLQRLGWHSRIGQVIDRDISLYAVGQGALAVECRADDQATLQMLAPLNHVPTVLCCEAERAFLRRLEGGCSVPAGVYAHYDEQAQCMDFEGAVYSLDGQRCVRHEHQRQPCTSAEDARSIGLVFAEALCALGADAILREVRAAKDTV